MGAVTNNVIEVSQTIKGDTGKIFNALTLGTEIEKWFACNAFTNPVVGGDYIFGFLFNDTKRNHERKGTFVELARPSKVVYKWMNRTLVTFTLEPLTNNETLVKLVHSGWLDNDESEIESHAKGWNFFLQNLKNVLEQGIDNRASQMEMVVKNKLAQTPSSKITM